MTIWIFTGGRPSNSAKALCATQGFRRLLKNRPFKVGDAIVNWGTSTWGDIKPMGVPKLVNTVAAIAQASNKLHAFGSLSGKQLSTVPWTANQDVVKEWQTDGATIVVRKMLTGHSGAGIIILEKGDELIDAPLYTKYIFKVREYRVHATRLKAFDTQQKIRDPNQEPKTWKVRSHENGFIFARNNITPSDQRDQLAVAAIQCLGLDFGAVDIVEDKKGNFYVLEVNTAPGLEGQTVDSYVNALQELSTNA